MSDHDESPDNLPTVAWARMKDVIDRFEEAWNQGGRPEIANFLPDDDDRLRVLRALLHIDLERRLESGEVVRLEAYLERFPELANDAAAVLDLVAAEYFLRRRCDAQVTVGEFQERFPQWGPRLADYLADLQVDAPTEADIGSRNHHADDTETHLGHGGEERSTDLPEIPDYEITQLIDRGGMGQVYQGRHRVLNRRVAIKLPHPKYAADREGRERLREARSTARLRHPNICPIYDVGQVDNRPYIVMEFIQGKTLREIIRGEQLTGHRAAGLVAKLARGVGYAHDHGVIHRDIKPANVIVDEESGEPVLTDFGLAKELTDDASLMTQDGQVMGTPAYMAPEQAAGQIAQVGPLSDVYALGALLYELLCGKPPFAGKTGEVLRKVQTEEPTALRKQLPRLHRDLETICIKTLAKRPADRYPSAAELAEDLERFCAGEAIVARRESKTRWALRRIRRYPGATALIGLSLIAVLIAAGIAWRVAHKAHRLETAHEQLSTLLQQMNDYRPQEILVGLPDIDKVLAQLAVLSPDRGVGAEQEIQRALVRYIETTLSREKIDDDEFPVLREIVSHLADRGSGDAQRLSGQLDRMERGWLTMEPLNGSAASLVDVLPADTFSLSGDAVVRTDKGAVDGPDSRVILPVPCPANVRFEATFAPPWDAAGEMGLLLGAVDGHAKDVVGLAFSPDGTLLASGSVAPEVKVWNVEEARLLATLPTASGGEQLTFSADGNALAVHCWTSEQTIWSMETYKLLDKRRATTPFGLSPNRRQMVSAFGQQIVVQSLDSGTVLQQFDYPDTKPLFVSLIDDAAQVVSSDDHTLTRWDATTGQRKGTSYGHRAQIRALAVDPSSDRVATGGRDCLVKVWDSETGELQRTFGRADFRLSLTPPDQSDPPSGGWLALRRAGLLVADTKMSFPSAALDLPLRLTIERLNGRVRAWVNPSGDGDEADLEFDEIFRSESPGQGLLGIVWPSGTGVAGCTAFQGRQAESLRQWGLAEKYFSQGPYDVASELYRDLAAQFQDQGSSEDATLWQEAKYKEAVSLQVLQQDDKAKAIFEQLRSSPGYRWPAYATAQLWAQQMIQGNVEAADGLLGELEKKQVSFRQIAAVIPDRARTQFLALGREQLSALDNWYRFDRNRVTRLRRTAVVEEIMLGETTGKTAVGLIRALRLEGNLDEALDMGRRLTADPFAHDDYVDEYAWMLRETGRHEAAANLIDRFLVTDDGSYDPKYARLLVDRALVEIQRDDRNAALAIIDRYLQLPADRSGRGHYSGRMYVDDCAAELARGFLLDDMGRTQEAKEAWQAAFRALESGTEKRGKPGLAEQLFWLISGSLSGQASAEEIGEKLDRLVAQKTSGAVLDRAAQQILPAEERAIWAVQARDAWLTPRGRQLARDIAYQQIPFPQFVRDPPLLLATHIFSQQVCPEGLSREEDELLWQLAQDWYGLIFTEGKMDFPQFGLIVVAWKTQLWLMAKPLCAKYPDIRGPLAHSFGLRYVRGPHAGLAADCFQTALTDAGDNLLLKKLAQRQLDKL